MSKQYYTITKSNGELQDEITRLTSALAAAESNNKLLKMENDALTKDMDGCVAERLKEEVEDAGIFDTDCWNALKSLCEQRPGFDWRDFDNEMTADDAYQYLAECFSEYDRTLVAAEQRADGLEAQVAGLREAIEEHYEAIFSSPYGHEASANKLLATLSALQGGEDQP